MCFPFLHQPLRPLQASEASSKRGAEVAAAGASCAAAADTPNTWATGTAVAGIDEA